jgi:ATP-binding cassette, subfamily B, bacterial
VRLPAAYLAAVRRLWRTARTAAPRQFTACIGIVLVGGTADALLALWVALAVANVINRRYTSAMIFGALVAATYCIVPLCERSKVTLRKQMEERATLALQAEQVRALLRPDALNVLESAEAAADLETLRRDRNISGQAAGLLVEDVGFLVRIIVSMALLVWVQPLLLLLLPVGALTIRAVGKAEEHEQEALRQSASQIKLARHLLHNATDPSTAADLLTAPDPDYLTELQTEARNAYNVRVAATRLHAARLAVLGWVPFVVAAVAALFGTAVAVAYGHLDVARLILVLLVIAQLIGQLSLSNELTRLVVRLAGAHASFTSLQRKMVGDRQRDSTLSGTVTAGELPQQLSDGIRLREVTYAYPSGNPVLHGIDLWLRPGMVVALVGENGSGKSTLAKLLLGLHSPTLGEILLDGADLRSLPVEDYQRRVSASLQDFARFEFIAALTVGVGDLPHAQDEGKIRRALRLARAEQFTDGLPKGLQTPLGRSFPDGSELSRGQWQRLALSRAKMRESALLAVLDEPTASLDAATEKLVYSQVARKPGTIILLVTHRLATTRHADLILVLENGRLVEQGTHEDLLQQGRKYHELYTIQAAGYAD